MSKITTFDDLSSLSQEVGNSIATRFKYYTVSKSQQSQSKQSTHLSERFSFGQESSSSWTLQLPQQEQEDQQKQQQQLEDSDLNPIDKAIALIISKLPDDVDKVQMALYLFGLLSNANNKPDEMTDQKGLILFDFYLVFI